MKLLPVAERELRVASRRRGTYWVRFGAAGLAIGMAAVILLSMLRQRPTEQSQVLFVALSVLAFAYCLLCGVWTTSDCVSEERRDGTLGLLFLTNLRGYDVVVGKLVASSMRAVTALVAMLPVMAVPILMGGVDGDVVWTTAAVLVNTLFLSLAFGVLVSSVSRDSRQAIGGTIALLLGLVALVPVVRWLVIEYAVRPRFAGASGELERMWTAVYLTNPVFTLAGTMSGLIRGVTDWTTIRQSLICQHLLAWLALAGACWWLPRSWRDRVASEKTRKPEGAVRPKEATRRRWQAEVLDLHPLAWVVLRERRAQVYLWVGLAVIAGVWLWGFLEVKEEWLQGFVALWTVFFAGGWLKLRMAAVASRHLLEQRRSGALELVLSTPMTPAEIVRGQMLGMRHLVFPPLATLVAAAGLLLIAAFGQEHSWNDRSEIPMTFVVGIAVLILDLVTVAYTGMWRGLRSGRYVRAFGSTVGLVLILPWALFVLSLVLMAVTAEALDLAGGYDPGYLGVLLWWALIAAGVDVALLVGSTTGLRDRFRDLAADPYGSDRPGEEAAATGSAAARGAGVAVPGH